MTANPNNDRAAWLHGPSEKCSAVPEAASPWRLVLLGPPGVGKGTQAALLTQQLTVCHLSTGDVFRAAKSRDKRLQSPAMVAAVTFMNRGDLVPDEIVWDMIRERIGCLRCGGGFVLDGFPRTLAQADSLRRLMDKEKLQLDAVLNYTLPEGEIISRLSGRRTCEKCRGIFHVTSRPPQREGICDHCGSKLCQREDDRAESIAVRLKAYDHSTAPLIEFYRIRGLLITIEASGTPQKIFERTVVALESRRELSRRAGAIRSMAH
jgi:adenylate kinase